MNSEAVLQLRRMLGESTADEAELREEAEWRAEDIARMLLEEAAACDDVIDSASAMAYLEDRLAFLGELLSEETRRRIREGFATVAAGWS